MVTSDPHDLQKTFCKLSASWYWTPPSPKPYTLTFPHCCFGAVSQSYLRCCLPGCSPHFTPNKTWTLWERARAGWYGRMALKHVNYHMWNKSPVQVWCIIQDARGWCTGVGREVGGGFRMKNTCTPMADSSQCIAKPIQCCKIN